MGDSSLEVSDENREASQETQAKGLEAVSNGNLEEAIEQFTKAILLNPTSAIMYAMRASVYIKLKKPNAAIRDADAALQPSPISIKGYKSRGTAWSMLGEWEKSAKDLRVALNMDFDEETNNILKNARWLPRWNARWLTRRNGRLLTGWWNARGSLWWWCGARWKWH